MDIKQQQQVWSIAKSKAGMNANKKLTEELHKEEKRMRDFKIIFGQQIQLKGDHCFLRINMLNINYVLQMILPNVSWLNL